MKTPGTNIDQTFNHPSASRWGKEGGILAFSFGFSSIVGQAALLREFMSLFSGHEIIIGVFLAFWMFFVGIGALSAKRSKGKLELFLLPMLMGFAFILGVLLLYFARNHLVIHGAEPEFNTILLIIAITLMPLCLITGFAFTKYSIVLSSGDKEWSITKVYFYEQLGSSVGGGILYIILIRWFDSVQILITVVFFMFAISAIVSGMLPGKKKLTLLLIFLTGVILLALPLQKMLRAVEFKSEKIVLISDTPYGNVVVTASDDQTNIYENSSLRSFSDEVERTEEDVHAVMMRHPDPHKVLMIGGASSGTFHELKKYGDISIDYVDIDPAIIEILKKSKDAGSVSFYADDPLRFLKKDKKFYDIIILNTGLPHNLQDNRFYSKEFFELARSKLNQGGILGVKGPEKQFHREDSYIRYLCTIAATGLTVFRKYDIFPGNNIFILFADGSFMPLFEERYYSVIRQNLYFNPGYILPDLVEDERLSYLNEINLKVPVNTCLEPRLLKQSIVVKSGYWQINSKVYVFVAFVLFVFVIVFFKNQSRAMAVTGSSLSGVQLALIFLMQIVAGNVYEVLGVLFALSMAGMALGSCMNRKYFHGLRISSAAVMVVAGILILTLPFVMRMLTGMQTGYVLQVVIVYVLVVLFSFIGGVLFSSLSYQPERATGIVAGSVYGADLFGSSAGVLLSSVFLFPVAGMVNAIFILGIICLMFGMLFMTKN